MRAAFGREADARGGTDDDEAGVGVEAVDEGVEPAQDEWVVDGADGDELLADQFGGEAEHGEHHKEIHLRDPELDVLAFGGVAPAKAAVFLELVDLSFGKCEYALLGDPA